MAAPTVLPTQGWAAGDAPRFADPVPPITPGEFGAAPSTPEEAGTRGIALLPTEALPGLPVVPTAEGAVCMGAMMVGVTAGLLNDGFVMEGVLNEGPVTEGLLKEGLAPAGPAGAPPIAPEVEPPIAPEGAVLGAPKEGLPLVPPAGLLEV